MTVHVPIPDFTAARAAMVDSQLRPQGVTDPLVLAAMGAAAREDFVTGPARPLAYVDRAVAIGGGRLISAPAALGQLLTQLAPRPGERALIVGAGSGYSAAILISIGLDVAAIESSPELAAKARGLGIEVIEAPPEAGLKDGAPYDLILIDGSVELIPQALVDQLADGGRLGAALLERGVTRLIAGRKAGGAFGYLSIGDAGVPALPGFSRPKEFTF